MTSGARDELPRTNLPIPEREHVGLTTYDAKDPDTSFPPIEPLLPPAGAPNVLVVLIDDTGFGASSAFGGPIDTPSAERLAGNGLKFNRFHTTALCSPTRAALLSGRNHHTVNMGGITEIATSAPGYTSVRPDNTAPLAEVLKLNGYSTAQFGKCHEVPVWETSPMGPYKNWPTGSGFEYFYGFIGGETNQYFPAIYEGTVPIEPPKTPEEGYHFTQDMTDKAIAWIHQQRSLMPDKPFFAYFAPGATHAPHQVPKEWSDKYRGRFDAGWDALREETFARQKELGVIPADCRLTTRPDEIPAWDDMPDELKPVLARQMEAYAGFLEHTDHHVGRLLDALEDLDVLRDTIVYYIIGDNGASAEGTINGTFNELLVLNGAAEFETAEMMASHIDEFGTPNAYNHYAVGWAHAMDTPYQWTKQVASHWGGTRNGTIVHWPSAHPGQWGGAAAVPSRDRHRGDRARRRGVARAVVRPRHPAEAAARREHDLLVRRRRRPRSPSDAVLRDVLQPRHLPQGLDCGHPSQHAVDDGGGLAELRRRRVGALRRHRLDAGARPRRRAAREAGPTPAALADRGGQVPGAATRRPSRRALQLRPRRSAATRHRRLTAALRRHGSPERELGPQHEEQVARRHGRDHRARRRRERRDHRPRRRVRGVGALSARGQARVLPQPLRAPALQDLRRHAGARRHAAGPDGIRVRRRRTRQGRRRHPVRRRRPGGGGTRRGDRPDGVFGRRDVRPRLGHGVGGERRLLAREQRVHRHGQLGAARRRRGRPRPPHHARATSPGRDGGQ